MILVWQPAAAPNCCTQELLHIVHSIPTNPAEYSSAHWTSPSIMQSFEMQQQWKTVWNSDTPLYRKVTLDCIEKQQEGLIVSPQLLHQSTLCLLWIWQMKFALKALVRWQYLLQSVNEKSQPDTIRSKRKLAHLWNLVCCWSRKVMLPPVLLLNLWWCLLTASVWYSSSLHIFPFLFPPWDRTLEDLIENSVAEVPMQEPLQNLMVQICITLFPAATRASCQSSPYIHFMHIATRFPWSTYDWASGHLSISDIKILGSNQNSFAALLHLQPDKNAALEGAEWWNLTTYQ